MRLVMNDQNHSDRKTIRNALAFGLIATLVLIAGHLQASDCPAARTAMQDAQVVEQEAKRTSGECGADCLLDQLHVFETAIAKCPGDQTALEEQNMLYQRLEKHPAALAQAYRSQLALPLTTMGVGGSRPDPRLSMQIPFPKNSAVLQPKAENQLDALASALREILDGTDGATAAFVIEGHADSTGSDAYNLDLSRRRAETVEAGLVARGIPRERLRAMGFGEQRLLSTGTSEGDHALNRRVEVVRVTLDRLAAFGEAPPAPAPPAPDETVVQFGVFFQDPESRPRKLKLGEALRSGDGYRLYLRPEQTGDLYIVQVDAADKHQVLYPNPKFQTGSDPAVAAGRGIWIPEARWFELDDTVGEETIHVITTRERRPDLEDLIDRLRKTEGATLADASSVLQELDATIKPMGVVRTRPSQHSASPPPVQPSDGQRAVSIASPSLVQPSTAYQAVSAGDVTVDDLIGAGGTLAYRFWFRHEPR
jgi:outer membrane protein OmpA-like peptidoglycan-associated protein